METQEIVLAGQGGALADSSAFMPVMNVEMAVQRRNQIVTFVKKIMVESEDFGTIPGTNKPTLLKPGAEKLQSFFGLEPEFQTVQEVTDWTGKDHGGECFFYIKYRCILRRGTRFVGYGEGSCNSWESKYRYRWVGEDTVPPGLDKELLLTRGGMKSMFEPDFAIQKAETTGQYGKPQEHWDAFTTAIANKTAKRDRKMLGKKEFDGWYISINQLQYRVPNPDIADLVNTVQKMAHKRAHIAAILNGTGASQFFTQDMEDFRDSDGNAIDTGGHKPGTSEAAQHVAERKLAQSKAANGNGKPAAQAQTGKPQDGAVEIPKAVTEMWAYIGTSKPKAIQQLGVLKKDAYEITGSNELYYGVLLKHGMNHANDGGWTMQGYRQAVRDLFDAIQAADGVDAGGDANEEFDDALPGGAQGARS